MSRTGKRGRLPLLTPPEMWFFLVHLVKVIFVFLLPFWLLVAAVLALIAFVYHRCENITFIESLQLVGLQLVDLGKLEPKTPGGWTSAVLTKLVAYSVIGAFASAVWASLRGALERDAA